MNVLQYHGCRTTFTHPLAREIAECCHYSRVYIKVGWLSLVYVQRRPYQCLLLISLVRYGYYDSIVYE